MLDTVDARYSGHNCAASLRCVFSYAPLDSNSKSNFVWSASVTQYTWPIKKKKTLDGLIEMTHSCIGHIHLVSLRCVLSYAISDHFS